MIIYGVIPARYNSTRLKGKPLEDINGKTMIQRVYEQAKKSRLLHRVVVATDDKRIFDAVKGFGGKAVMTSRKHKSGTDRIGEAVKGLKCDIVVNIQGDEPFIPPGNIDMAVRALLDERKVNVSTLAKRFDDEKEIKDSNKVKVVLDNNNFALYFSRSVIPFDRDSNKKRIKYYKHIGLYAFRKKYLLKFIGMKHSALEKTEKLEQLRILENGGKIKVVAVRKDSLSVDTNADLKRARAKL